VSWEVREAVHDDVPAVAAGVSELLVELGGKPALIEDLEGAAHALIEDPDAGVLLVAEDEGVIVGVLPERFLERPAGTYTWIPFGGGVRRCLAADYAHS
jgi:hypothetical protein